MPVRLMQEDDRIVVRDDQLGVPEGDSETTYTLRPLTRAVYKSIVRAHTDRRPNRRTGTMEEIVDWNACGEDLIDHALVAWSGILWNGQPAPCDREMKLKLDGVRTMALLERAGMSQVATAGTEDRAASFP